MAKHPLSKRVAREIQLEAEQIAKSLQKPGQTREHTRLIARGIQQGIETYRRRQAEKERDFDKELKRLKKEAGGQVPEPVVEKRVVYRQHWLPWVLLAASLALLAYLMLTGGSR
jgi:hypothetical protein